jgi:hypothetical protein
MRCAECGEGLLIEPYCPNCEDVEWVKCEEGLPEQGVDVLVIDADTKEVRQAKWSFLYGDGEPNDDVVWETKFDVLGNAPLFWRVMVDLPRV